MPDPGVRRLDAALVLRLHGLRGEIHPFDAMAFAYPSLEVFEASAKRDREIYGNEVHGPYKTEAGVIGIVDMRPQLRAKGGLPADPSAPDDRPRPISGRGKDVPAAER